MKNASLIIHPEELSYKWIDRLVEMGIPTLALHPVGGEKADESLRNMCDLLKTEKYREMLDYAAEKGLAIEYEMHSARYLLPAEEFSAHPEWFRMNENGERTNDYNLCCSNEEALDYVAESAARLAKALYRSTSRYFFWLDDGKKLGCNCPKCKNLSESDQQLIVLNRILERLKKDNENATLAYLAYCSTITPPTVIKPIEGIFPEYAPFLRDFHKPIYENEECIYLPKLLDFFGGENAKVLEYWYDNSLYSGWKKPPKEFSVDRPVIEADFEYYHKLGFEDISSFACYLGEDYEELYGEPNVSDFGKQYAKYSSKD